MNVNTVKSWSDVEIGSEIRYKIKHNHTEIAIKVSYKHTLISSGLRPYILIEKYGKLYLQYEENNHYDGYEVQYIFDPKGKKVYEGQYAGDYEFNPNSPF